jgi:hypothetical protein
MLHISPKKEFILVKTKSEEEREILIRSRLIENSTYLLLTMSKNSRRNHCEVREGSKLIGIQNFNIWCIKMEAILRRKSLWSLVEHKQSPVSFPTTIEGITYLSKDKLQENKARVRLGLIFPIADKLIHLVASKQDPVDSLDHLKKMYNVGDQ